MKGIFISQAVLNKNNGGGQFVKSLIGLLRSIIGDKNLTVVSLPDENDTSEYYREEENLIIYDDMPSKIQMIKNLLAGCPKWVSTDIFNRVIKLIKLGDYDFVFLGFSTYEYLIKKIKKETNLPVFVMYQGVAPNTKKSKLVNASIVKKILAYPAYCMVLKREKINTYLADCNIVHNIRERRIFFHYYHKEPDLLLPVFIADKFSEIIGDNPGYKGFSLLFVGSYFGPNLSGLKWFVENVMTKTNNEVQLYVIGQGMEVLRNEPIYQSKNIHIIGEVESLGPWYYYADLVVAPIFEGDGMKTKTVEAMMYGKTILGTDEAFCGYEGLNDYLCNNPDDFIRKIEQYRKNGIERVNYKIRNVYLSKYSEQAVKELMRKAIERHVNSKTSL